MQVRDLMTSPALTVPLEAPRDAVAALLVAHGIASAPVVDAGSTLLGAVDEADLVRAAPRTTAAEVMAPAGLVGPEEPVADVVARMVAENRRSLVVVRDGAVLGVVSRRDVLRQVARGEQLSSGTTPGTRDGDAGGGTVVVAVDSSDSSIRAL